MHRILLLLTCAILVGCMKAPDSSGDAEPVADAKANAALTHSWRQYGAGGELYTDTEAEALRDQMNKMDLPTTPEKACAAIGIDISRLEEPIGDINGRVMIQSTRLSKGYYIHFGSPIGPTNVVAEGGRVTAVRVLATNSTESIYVPNLEDEDLQNKSVQATK
jgi:hypothetical protein